MADIVEARANTNATAAAALKTSAALWFVVAALGQWVFAYYIAVQYGASAFGGNLARWNEVLFSGLIEGDLIGNVALMIHLLIAFTITIGGTLQLIPQIRKHAPRFHRWNGRVYMVTAFLTSIAALYMVITRDGFGGPVNDVAISINAALIMAFAAWAWRAAMARNFAAHQRWALRLFLVVSGVWFLRLSYGLLVVIVQGAPPGVGENMDGPTDYFLMFASYLVPLAVLELYFRAQQASGGAKFGMAALLLLAAIATGIGVAGASLIFWLPRLS
jgi:hypothetical protein